LTLFLLLLDYYVIRPILFYYIFDCPNPASGLQYRNKRIRTSASDKLRIYSFLEISTPA